MDVLCILESCCCSYSSLYFFIFLHLQFSNIKIFVTLFSGIVRPRRLKLGTHMESGQMYRVYQNQAAAACSSLYFFIFLLQFLNIEIFRHTFLRNYLDSKVETWYTHGQFADVLCIRESGCCCLFVALFCICLSPQIALNEALVRSSDSSSLKNNLLTLFAVLGNPLMYFLAIPKLLCVRILEGL